MVNSTQLIPDTAAASDDSRFMAAIETTFKRALGATNVTYRAGIRNESGVIYREVVMDSLDQLPALTNRLRKLGLIEEMDEEGCMVDGYDVTYRFK
ncbi:hypothetical protein [Comamonas jiangduensis]|uniref:hypothetical protein n=1 Tax=Comamonas jiangduensis TaxID=1194168 RepID=UPI0028A982B6|nr:hypothetical protein [Comamonas jiangduensis]